MTYIRTQSRFLHDKRKAEGGGEREREGLSARKVKRNRERKRNLKHLEVAWRKLSLARDRK